MNYNQKTNQEIMAAARQVSLLVTALENAAGKEDIWLNPTGKTAPRFYPKGATISPFNSLVLALHSDKNNYRTNEYTLFSELRDRGMSVLAGEKGVPFNWYNWSRYVNRNNPNDIISRNDYMKLSPEEKEAYKGVKKREVRILFNVEQTTYPLVDEERFKKDLLLHGTSNDRGNLLAQERQTRRVINQLISLAKKNLVPIRRDGTGIAHYDPSKDAVYLPEQKNFSDYRDYVQELMRQIVTATGHPERLAREGMKSNPDFTPSTDAQKQERLVTELASGVLCMELGIPAKLSEESKEMVDYWCRELKENPRLIDIVESEVNNAVGIVHRVNQNISIEKNAELHQKRTEAYKSDNPKNYFIVDEIKNLPNKDTKEFVIVKDKATKSADVILPSGASTTVNNEIPGMNKNRIGHVLQRQGYNNIMFYNPDGALGYSPDDSYFKGKDVIVAKMNNWELVPQTRLDVSDAVSKANEVNFTIIQMIRDDDRKWMLHLKPLNETAFSIYPDREDVNQYFTTMKNGTGEQFEILRQQLANKYYRLALNHPELKVDMWKANEDIDVSRIEKAVIFKTEETENEKGRILCLATIKGIGRPQPREVTQQQWQRMWLANCSSEYKKQLAATIFADLLKKEQSQQESIEEKESSHEEKTQEIQQQNAESPETPKEVSQVSPAVSQEKQISPIMEEFIKLKQKHPDRLFLFKIGDFYETYKEDAVTTSNVLGIILTKSSSLLDNEGKPLEMAGFPAHSIDTYLPKLIRSGQRVAIYDSPKATQNLTPASENVEKQEAAEETANNKGHHR